MTELRDSDTGGFAAAQAAARLTPTAVSRTPVKPTPVAPAKKSRTMTYIVIALVVGMLLVSAGLFIQLRHRAHPLIAQPLPTPSTQTTVTSGGITLTLATKWLVIPSKPSELAAFLAAQQAAHPQLQSLVTPGTISKGAILAMTFLARGQLGGTLNAVTTRDTTPAPEVLKQVPALVAAQGGEDEVATLTTYNGYPSVRLSFVVPGDAIIPTTYQAVAFVVGPHSTAQVTITAPTNDAAEALLDQVAATIKLN
jgi:hypothetical protein